MVSVVRPPPPPLLLLPPPPLSLLPPQAATPKARAVTRQPAAATERTCKGPSSGTRYRRCGILGMAQDDVQCPARPARYPGVKSDRAGSAQRRSGAPVARQVAREHVHRDGHQRDQHRDQERVERLGA